MLGVNYGSKVVYMSDADFRCYVMDVLVEDAVQYFSDEGRKPTLEEFRDYLAGLLEEEFDRLRREGIMGVVYFPPHGEGDPVFIYDAEKFLALVEREYGIKDLYEDTFREGLKSQKAPGR